MKVIWSIELVLLALLALIQPLQAKDWPKEPLADVQQAAERGDVCHRSRYAAGLPAGVCVVIGR